MMAVLSAATLLLASLSDVVLIDDPDQLTLRNEHVSVTMRKSNGLARPQVDALSTSAFPGRNLLWTDQRGGGCYLSTVPPFTETNGSKVDCMLSNAFVGHNVVRESPEFVEISFASAPACGFQVDIHYVLRAQEAGFYFYFAVNRTGNHTLDLPLGQLRLACRLDPGLFTTVAVPDESRVGQAAQMLIPGSASVAPAPAAQSL